MLIDSNLTVFFLIWVSVKLLSVTCVFQLGFTSALSYFSVGLRIRYNLATFKGNNSFLKPHPSFVLFLRMSQEICWVTSLSSICKGTDMYVKIWNLKRLWIIWDFLTALCDKNFISVQVTVHSVCILKNWSENCLGCYSTLWNEWKCLFCSFSSR